jgi:hypothetical protein
MTDVILLGVMHSRGRNNRLINRLLNQLVAYCTVYVHISSRIHMHLLIDKIAIIFVSFSKVEEVENSLQLHFPRSTQRCAALSPWRPQLLPRKCPRCR